MIYGYKNHNDGIITVLVAATDEDEMKKVLLRLEEEEFDVITDKEFLTPMDMMMDDEFESLSKPVVRITHADETSQNTFFDVFPVKEIDIIQSKSKQDEMIKNQERILVDKEDERKRLVAEISGETYVSPSIEEVYGLNLYDPFKPEDTKKTHNNQDGNILEETMFGGADEQRAARDAARLAADPDYVPVRLGGFGTDEDGDFDMENIILKYQSKPNLLPKSAEEEMNDEEVTQEVTDTSKNNIVHQTKNEDIQEYVQNEENLETLEFFQEEASKTNEKVKSLHADESVRVITHSLPSNIHKKVIEITQKYITPTNNLVVQDSIDEFWYYKTSTIDGYYFIPQDRPGINGAWAVAIGYNIDTSNMKKISINGPQVQLLKKLDESKDALVLYSRITKTSNGKQEINIPEFFLVRLK